MGKDVQDANTYRIGHPLAQRVLEWGKNVATPPAEVTFDYAGSGKNIAILEPLRGRCGWLVCARLTVSALETEDLLVFAGITDDGMALEEAQCRRLFDLPATQGGPCTLPAAVAAVLDEARARRRQALLEEMTDRNARWFDTEMDKLDRWAEDRRASLKAELAELDEALKEAKKAARLAPTLPEKLERQRVIRNLEAKREEAWRAYDAASREIDRQKDALLDEISSRLEQRIEEEQLFALRWSLT
ncbi:MAG: OmpH family outer membrane protein [Bacillota bacterium]